MDRKKNRNDTGIDGFRIIAALLVITIHTSPLLSFSETADFILTRIIARTAVPFFFMTSGYFLISRYTRDEKKLYAFLKKTLFLYGISILIYIPVNIYSGYFRQENIMLEIIKDLVFDGTFYHLWYLPASAAGAAISWYLIKKLRFRKALIISGILYLIGLFGDSYYGLIEPVSGVNAFYRLVFQISDYTRNGIFFTPLFFILGGLIADRKTTVSEKSGPVSLKISVYGFAVSFLLMFGEAMLLHHYELQRHDSMYLFLPLCMYFLFHLILYRKGRRSRFLRTSALIIYIIHPMMIVVLRLFAKISGLQKMLIDNSLIHFLSVSLLSVCFSMAAVALWNRCGFGRFMKKPVSDGMERAWIEVDLKNLEHNVTVLRDAMPAGSELMAVVKDEGYGHGAFETAVCLERIGVKAFAAATIEEGIQLRKYGIRGEILILGYTAPCRVRELKKYDLMQTAVSLEHARALNKQGVFIKVHIKIDTGMHRLGIADTDADKVKKIFRMKYLKVCGIYTHLCCADSLAVEDVIFTKGQISRFYHLIDTLKESKVPIPKLHIQSSYGLLNYPELKCDYVRIGIALYGVLSSPDHVTRRQLHLRPVLSLKTRVVLIRKIPKGESVGYGRSFTAERDSLIAVLSVGYGDGFPRHLSDGKAGALIGGRYAPVVGRICMDQLAVDITDAGNVSVGDIAALIGTDGGEISAPVVAENAGSISNELLCRMGVRLKRYIV